MGGEGRPADKPTRDQVIEYLLIVTLVVVIAATTLLLFSTQLGDILASISEQIHSP